MNPNSNAQSDSQPRTLHATVTGRVQGVGFRAFVWDHARALGLHGYVRNRQDGSVYVVASGPLADLQRLLDALNRGPGGARVSHVAAQWLEGNPEGFAHGFEVRA